MQIEKALEKRFSKDFSKYLQTALPKKLSVSAATWWRWKKGSRSPSTQQVRDMVNFINEHLPKNKVSYGKFYEDLIFETQVSNKGELQEAS